MSVFHEAGVASSQGMMAFLQFVAFISVVLGVFNLFPIPGLDGGHVVFCLIEIVCRQPLPFRIQLFLTNLGISLLLSIMLYATFNDLLRLFV